MINIVSGSGTWNMEELLEVPAMREVALDSVSELSDISVNIPVRSSLVSETIKKLLARYPQIRLIPGGKDQGRHDYLEGQWL